MTRRRTCVNLCVVTTAAKPISQQQPFPSTSRAGPHCLEVAKPRFGSHCSSQCCLLVVLDDVRRGVTQQRCGVGSIRDHVHRRTKRYRVDPIATIGQLCRTGSPRRLRPATSSCTIPLPMPLGAYRSTGLGAGGAGCRSGPFQLPHGVQKEGGRDDLGESTDRHREMKVGMRRAGGLVPSRSQAAAPLAPAAAPWHPLPPQARPCPVQDQVASTPPASRRPPPRKLPVLARPPSRLHRWRAATVRFVPVAGPRLRGPRPT